jgi:two-component system chemotaxis response regulator CheB
MKTKKPKVIIVGSAGSPNIAIELLKVKQELYIPVIICIHFSGNVMETYANHIVSETMHPVYIVKAPMELTQGIYLPQGGKDIVFVTENIVNSVDSEYKVHPSISKLFESLVKFADNNVTIIVLGGLGDDGKDYAKKLKSKWVRFIIEKKPQFPYLPENIAKELESRYEKVEHEKIKEIIIGINNMVKNGE